MLPSAALSALSQVCAPGARVTHTRFCLRFCILRALGSLAAQGRPEAGRPRKTPRRLTALTGLRELDLRGCYRLTELPSGLAALTGLRELDLRMCYGLTELPAGLTSLTVNVLPSGPRCQGPTMIARGR